MSAQTIIHPSISSMRKEAEDLMIANANKYILQSDYALGEGYCNFGQTDAEIIYDIIQYNNCHLLNLIKKEIESIEDSEKRSGTYLDIHENSAQSLYELWLSKGNMDTIENFLNIVAEDTKANWDTLKW